MHDDPADEPRAQTIAQVRERAYSRTIDAGAGLHLDRGDPAFGLDDQVDLGAPSIPVVADLGRFLEEEMAAGRLRPRDPGLVLIAAYSVVMGVATEVEVLGALGQEQTLRSLVRRRNDLLALLRDALVT